MGHRGQRPDRRLHRVCACPDPAAGRKGHIGLFARILYEINGNRAVLPAGQDVEEYQFIRLQVIEDPHRIDRIADVARIFELNGFDQAPAFQQENGNDARAEHVNIVGTHFCVHVLLSVIGYRLSIRRKVPQ